MKKYPRLILVFTAILVFMCRQSTTGTQPMGYIGGSGVSCKAFNEYGSMFTVTASGYTCPLTCQDGSIVEFDVPNDFPFNISYSKADLQSKYCAAGIVSTPTATLEPAPTSTETPISAAPVPPVAAPLLTGKVTTCDLESRYINFRLVEGAPVVSGDEVVLTMNGTPLKCSVPPSNKSVLSCLLPAGVQFPVQVSIAIGDSVANQFSYNGEECFYVEPTNTGVPTSLPAVTPTPT